jgi:hypothetical protein
MASCGTQIQRLKEDSSRQAHLSSREKSCANDVEEAEDNAER